MKGRHEPLNGRGLVELTGRPLDTEAELERLLAYLRARIVAPPG